MKPVTIDGETADRITALTIAQHRDWMIEHLDKAFDGGRRLHDEEIGRYTRLIRAANTLLEEYFEVPVL
jgi:hypothetical protein